jgi:hypothetical protein
MKGPDGEMQAIKVADMTDAHLFRWIRYFRKKWRDEGRTGSDADLDVLIRVSIVTAPAIYAEAAKRGVYAIPPVPTASPFPEPVAPVPVVPAPAGRTVTALVPGARRIDLNEE